MNRPITFVLATLLLMAAASPLRAQADARGNFRLLYWNIQNGMWDGQTDEYFRFSDWVQEQRPDVCVFCEAVSIFVSNSTDRLPDNERFLPEGWEKLARRWGHKYVYMGGWRDNYPQVITSRFPIENVSRIVGNDADSVVTHGAGWARIVKNDRTLNIVTLHTWPMKWTFGAPVGEHEQSAADHGGDRYRRMEMEYICTHTILSSASAPQEYWMMMGDFNSRSRKDNWVYHYAEDSPAFLVHDYILGNTPYLDVIAERNPDNFYSSTGGKSRIDFIYCTKPLYDCIVDARIVTDAYTRPRRNPQKLSNFWHPSDHRPIIVDFKIIK